MDFQPLAFEPQGYLICFLGDRQQPNLVPSDHWLKKPKLTDQTLLDTQPLS